MSKESKHTEVITEAEAIEIRNMIAQCKRWQNAKSARYKDCPHQYIVLGAEKWKGCEKLWHHMAVIIAKYGKVLKWRKQKYKFFHLDGRVYWFDDEVLNRANERNLENEGYNEGYPVP